MGYVPPPSFDDPDWREKMLRDVRRTAIMRAIAIIVAAIVAAAVIWMEAFA